ncbi:hypothetical protein GCM10010430_78050 [Kitasatospora cystarginea]|uniref:PPM-type phosphatase domain-containing protein n=1 Tax=Kitasatospora cystarginea TaxID=58350 RepID=A0ABN3F1F1_9ACTN
MTHRAQLEPGDRILIHTEGVTEGRSRTGEMFGEARLVDTIVHATIAGEPAPEALRRLIRTILEHQDQRLTDDATHHPPARMAPCARHGVPADRSRDPPRAGAAGVMPLLSLSDVYPA